MDSKDFGGSLDKDPNYLSKVDTYNSSSEHNEYLETIHTAELPQNLAGEVAYGRNGFRGIIESPFVFGAAMLASLGGFSFGYDQGVISIINVMPQFHETFPYAKTGFGKGFMTGMLELGAFIGCFFMPYMADKISRKWALTIVVIIFDIGAIIQTASQNYGMLVAGRTIGGIGVGTLALGAPLYISEIAPPNLRGSLLVLDCQERSHIAYPSGYAIIAILSGLFDKSWITHKAEGWAAVAMAFLFIMIYGVSYSPLGWCLPSEVFPNALRSKGVAVSTATVWLCNFIVGVATPPMIENIGFGTYVFFAAFCFLAGVWAYFLVPETRGRTLEQMDEAFGDNSGQEEKELMKQSALQARSQRPRDVMQV
ncbi:hexose carrier protein, partial [Aureobasidium melanogenum]